MTAQGRSEEKRPRWHRIALNAAPRIGNIYWCKFHDPDHVCLPEMWKDRPVVVVSHRGLRLKGSCLVVPTSTDPQEQHTWSFRMPDYVSEAMDGREMWVIYSHLITVSTSRLYQHRGRVLRLNPDDLDRVLGLIRDWLPSPRS